LVFEAEYKYDFGAGNNELVHSSLALPDGKFLLIGYSDSNLAVSRYLSSGAKDTSFGSGGIVELTVLNANDYGYRATLAADGKILISGYAENGVNKDLTVTRLNYDGSVDTAFGTNGSVSFDISGNDYGYAIASLADGKILVAGRAGNDIALVRLLGDYDYVVNSAPTLNALENLELERNAGETAVGLTGITAGGENQLLRVTATSSDPAIIPNPVVTYVTPDSTGSIALTPVTNALGLVTITVTVEDAGNDDDFDAADDNASFSQTFTVTVAPREDTPAVFGGDSTGVVGRSGEATGILTATDLDGISAAVPYSIHSQAQAGHAVIFGTTGQWVYVPGEEFTGTDTFTVRVTDDFGWTTDQTVTISGTPRSNNGVLDDVSLGQATVSQPVNHQVSLAGVVSPPSANLPTRATATSSNTAVVPNPTTVDASAGNPSHLVISPAIGQSGVATVTVTIEDGGLDRDLDTPDDNVFATQQFLVTVVADNATPTLDALTNVTILENAAEQVVALSGITAGGSDVQPLRVTASSSDTALIPNPTVTYSSPNATGSLAFTPTPHKHGAATITVTVEDGGIDGNLTTTDDNLIFSQTFEVTVQPDQINTPPTIGAIPDLIIEEDAAVQLVRLAGISSGDGDTQPFTVMASSNNPNLLDNLSVSHLPEPGGDIFLLSFSPNRNKYGTTTVTVTVIDGGLDSNLGTTDDNGSTSQSFTVTVTPDGDETDTPTPLLSRMFIHEVQPGSGLASHQLPAINAFGEPLNGLKARITAASADTGLIPDPTVVHTTTDVPGAIAFSPVAGAYGTTVITLTVEDGGADNDLTTTGDNGTASHQVEVTVLRVIAEGESATLGADGDENLYANTLPVTLDGQQAGTTINGFAAFGAESTESGNSVLVRRAGAEYRLVSENTWEIIGMFDSLRNRTRRVLDVESRGVNHIAEISLLAGAFAVAGQESPDLVVRRGQTYVFDLNTLTTRSICRRLVVAMLRRMSTLKASKEMDIPTVGTNGLCRQMLRMNSSISQASRLKCSARSLLSTNRCQSASKVLRRSRPRECEVPLAVPSRL
jgi:uncharacterized delta-60 repeat protein